MGRIEAEEAPQDEAPQDEPGPRAPGYEASRELAADADAGADRARPRLFDHHLVHQRTSRSMLVEFVRLVMVALFAVAGWTIASQTGPATTGRLLLGIFMGCAVGFVVGGMIGRSTASAAGRVEREFRRTPAPEILAGAVGMVIGMLPAALLSVPLFHLPPVAAFSTVSILYYLSGYVGYRVGRAKSDELFAMFGVKPKAAGTRAGEVSVLDTSAILDGRIEALVKMGFLTGTLLVPAEVLAELQAVADSSDPARRSRGRRGLDLLLSMKRDPSVDVVLVEEDESATRVDVDARLVRLARERGGVLVTNDANLAKVAAAVDVRVRSIHALADALRPVVRPGDRVEVRLTRTGRESGQGVGYLDDGTMVVVEDAADLLGASVSISVTNVLQTSNGQLVFARLAEDESGREDEPGDIAS
ncbi:MAG TPA: PIN domain-containing protein [Actinomycetota bacterium]|jgi:uncharacterized protein YacL